jgi:CRISPR/Cas system-associated exonuclease Cas4 (RecB family)
MGLGHISHLGLIYQIIDSFDKNENSDDVFYFKTSQKFVHVDIKMERFIKLLSDVIQCLESEIPPLSNKKCNYCIFAEKYNNFD